jgi:(E)-4-hydroxy-3-methylbut-2-enyl-diphosphate synthase
MDAAEAFKLIKQQVSVPLVADIHFDYRIALKVAEYGVDCLRINPGNIGNEERIRMVVDCARDKNIPIRIGVNAGSWKKICRKNTASRRRRRCSNPRCAMSIISIVLTSISSKSA